MTGSQAQALLVLRAQCGDRQALEELLQGVEARLHRYLVGLIGDPHRADDVLQETFVLAWRKLGWLREPELFLPWVHRIATREAFRRIRRERSAQEVVLDPELVEAASGAGDPAATSPEASELLPELVAGLPPASRAVLLLHYWGEMTLEQAAEVLDIPLGTVKSRLHYGLAALRRGALRLGSDHGSRARGLAR